MELASIPRQVAYLRLGYGAAALLSPKLATVAIGGRPSQVTPVAMGWARVFGTRDMAFGVLTLSSEDVPPATRRKILLLEAAVDAVDALAMIALARRQRSILPLLLAVPPGLASAAAHFLAAQQLSNAPVDTRARDENVYATA